MTNISGPPAQSLLVRSERVQGRLEEEGEDETGREERWRGREDGRVISVMAI